MARDELDWAAENWQVALAEFGPLGQVRPGWEETGWGALLSADLLVWRVVLTTPGGLSAEVIVDSRHERVFGTAVGIAN